MNKYKQYKEDVYKEAKAVTSETIGAFIEKLRTQSHDYDTCCYDVAAAAVAAASLLAGSIGITGFQASAVMWEFLEQFNHVELPARLLIIKDMMYPQHEDKYTTITAEIWEWLQQECQKSWNEAAKEDFQYVHPNVKKHWESIILDEKVPFGYKIKKPRKRYPGDPEAVVVQR